MSSSTTISRRGRPPRVFAALLFLLGGVLIFGGFRLVALGGSWYYLLAGLALVTSGVLLWLGRMLGAWVYAAMCVATIAWALWEVGLDGWQLAPRVIMWLVLGLWLLLPRTRRGLS